MSHSLTPIVPFSDRHAPQVWGDLVFRDPNTEAALREYAEHQRFYPVLLLGDVGTAKSTIASLIVKTRLIVNGYGHSHIEFLTTDDVRQRPKAIETAIGAMHFYNSSDHEHFVIIDDFDTLDMPRQVRVRQQMQQMQAARLLFTVNDLTKVDRSIVNRCDVYQIDCPTGTQMLNRAKAILRAEGVAVPDATLINVLAPLTSMRAMMRVIEDLVLKFRRLHVPSTVSSLPTASVLHVSTIQGNAPAASAPLVGTMTSMSQAVTAVMPSNAPTQASGKPTP